MGAHSIDEEGEAAPKARRSIYTVVLDWLSKQERGRVLDAPAGYGYLARRLSEMGYEVVCGEIDPDIFKAHGIECVPTDLNRGIDAPDASFDYVCCLDGLEHMTDPYRAVAEFARVLRPGGTAIFSLPNYSNMEKRFKYAFKGYLTRPKTAEDFRREGSNLFNFHNSPLTITILDLMFAINGLRVVAILRDRRKKKQDLFLPFVLGLKLMAALSPRASRQKHRYDLTLRNEVILGGNTLIIITRKDEGSGLVP
jgi:SAM-dependent methyltransferase